MAHAQEPEFVFRRNGRVHLNRRGRQFSRLLAAEVCASAVVMLDTPRSEVVWRVLATHSIRQFPLHFPSRASPRAIRFQTHSTCHTVTVSNSCFLPRYRTFTARESMESGATSLLRFDCVFVYIWILNLMFLWPCIMNWSYKIPTWCT